MCPLTWLCLLVCSPRGQHVSSGVCVTSPGGSTCPLTCLYVGVLPRRQHVSCLSVCSPGGGTCPQVSVCHLPRWQYVSSDMWLCLSVCSPGGSTCPLTCLSVCSPGGGTCPLTCLCLSCCSPGGSTCPLTCLSVCSPGGGTCPLTCLCLSCQYLKKGNLQEPAESSGNPWVSFLSANPEVAGETRPEYAPNTPDRPLNTPQTF